MDALFEQDEEEEEQEEVFVVDVVLFVEEWNETVPDDIGWIFLVIGIIGFGRGLNDCAGGKCWRNLINLINKLFGYQI